MNDNSINKSVSPVNGTDDREACQKYWIALYTRPRSEKKVKDFLDKKGFETYLPIQKQMRQWSDRKKLVDIVVMPMTIFVNIAKEDLLKIINNPLILKPFIFPGSKEVAKIPANQIEQLKFILGQSDYPVEYVPKEYKIKDNVRIIRGSLIGLIGEVIAIHRDLIEMAISFGELGCARLRIDKKEVELSEL